MRSQALYKRLVAGFVCALWAFFAIHVCAQSVTPPITGDYGGTDIQWLVRLHVRQTPSGSMTGTYDIVDQGVYGIPCADLVLAGTHFSFAIPAVDGKYEGEVSADGNTVKGTWTQGEPRPLVFTRNVPATAATLTKQLAQIDAMVAAEFSKKPVGSVTIGVVSGGQLIWTKSYGSADMEKHLPADKDTVYRIGSVTKMFTAIMLDQLVETGKVHLSDPVRRYLPEIALVQGKYPNAPPITLLQLATHTSGLGREPDDMDRYNRGPSADWEKTLIAALPHLHYVAEPGTRFVYSNMGYAVLGAALSRAANQMYLRYVPAHIFAPLGMTHTALQLTPALQAHLSSGYELAGDKVDAATPLSEQAGRGYRVPNGAMYTTVGDLAKFASFLMGNGPESVLKTASLQHDLDQVMVSSNSRMTEGYGLGFMVRRRAGYVAFGHGGDLAGYQAALYINRDKSIGFILLTNTSNGPIAGDLAYRSLDLLSK